MKKLFKQTATDISDGFTKWVVQRVKQLNSQVDADVLAEFIENVDSPDEVCPLISLSFYLSLVMQYSVANTGFS